MEVHGALADTILPWSRAWLILVLAISTVLSCWSAPRFQGGSVAHLARFLLVPLLAFVIFNQVFSPQYMIWLLPLAAMAGADGNPRITLAIALATMLTPTFYPSPEYNGAGLNLFQTQVLVLRNIILLLLLMFLIAGLSPTLTNPLKTEEARHSHELDKPARNHNPS
jgi:hypothetical protein